MSSRVEIYTKAYCAYCKRAKELLRIKGVSFVEHDITKAHPRAAEMRKTAQLSALPKIFINDDLIGGCLELFALDEKGALDVLLGLEPQRVTLSGESFQ